MLPKIPMLDLTSIAVQSDPLAFSNRSSSVRPIQRTQQFTGKITVGKSLVSGDTSVRFQISNSMIEPCTQDQSDKTLTFQADSLDRNFILKNIDQSERLVTSPKKILNHLSANRNPNHARVFQSQEKNSQNHDISFIQEVIAKYKEPHRMAKKYQNTQRLSLPSIQNSDNGSTTEKSLMERILKTERKWDQYKLIKSSDRVKQMYNAVTVQPNLDQFRQFADEKLLKAISSTNQSIRILASSDYRPITERPLKREPFKFDKESDISSADDLWKDYKNESQNFIEKDVTEASNTVHEVFHKIKDYSTEILSKSSIQEFDHLCDALLNPQKDISPLLQNYDKLKAFGNFTLPSEKMLRLDQDFFRQFIMKMRRAQKYEIRQTKDIYLRHAQELISNEVQRLQHLVKEQFLVFCEFDEAQKNNSFRQQAEISSLTQLLGKAEQQIVEMKTYITTLNKNLVKESYTIQQIETEPKPAKNNQKFIDHFGLQRQLSYEQDNKVEYPQMLKFQHYYLNKLEFLKSDLFETQQRSSHSGAKIESTQGQIIEKTEFELDANVTNKSTAKMNDLSSNLDQEESIGTRNGNLESSKRVETATHSFSAQSISLKPIYDPADGKFLGCFPDSRGHVKDILWVQNQVEPLLSEPFSFYGSHLWVSQHDKVNIMKNELFLYYKGKLQAEKERNEIHKIGQDYIIDQFSKLMHELFALRLSEEKMRDEMLRFKEACTKEKEEAIQKAQQEARFRVGHMYQILQQHKQYFAIELGVADEIAQRTTAKAHYLTEQIRKMQFIAKVPRLRDDYIAKNGVDPFIERFTCVVAEQQSIIEQKKLQEEQLKQRQYASLYKHKVVTRQPELLSQVGIPISSELVIRKTFQTIKDKYAHNSPTNRNLSSQRSLDKLVKEAQIQRNAIQKFQPFKPILSPDNNVEAAIPRALMNLDFTQKTFLEQYKIQFLNQKQNLNRAPVSSHFQMANQTSLNKSIENVIIKAQQHKFMQEHIVRLKQERLLLSSQPEPNMHKYQANESITTPKETDPCTSGYENHNRVSQLTKNMSTKVFNSLPIGIEILSKKGILRTSASQEVVATYQEPSEVFSIESKVTVVPVKKKNNRINQKS